jgi:hypothetical protein
MSKKASAPLQYDGYPDRGHLEVLNYLNDNQKEFYKYGNLYRDNVPPASRNAVYRERHHSQYDVYFGDNNQDPPIDRPVPAAAAVMQHLIPDAAVNNMQVKKVTCPTCRKENTITDIDNCHTHSRSGELPEDYEEKAAKIRELGMSAPAECCICRGRYADVTLPNCKHDDICHKCVVNMAT